ncbi:MAG: hypothetical protein ACFFEV_09420, partial [Candidatus Thorarchaeota archaeon]
HYQTLGRDTVRHQPMISTVPSTMTPDEMSKAGLSDSDSILLPSMIAFSSMGADAGILLLRKQLEFIEIVKDTIDPSRLIVRVPENVSLEEFKSYVREFHSKGIRAAAFTFDGLLGSSDFESIYLRSVLPTSWLSIALGKIAPNTIPLLFYTGFDIIDSGYSLEAAVTGIRLWRNDSENIEAGKPHRFCSCIHCVSFSDDSDSKLIETLQNHNLDVYTEVLSEATYAMKKGELRWLVESMTHASPNHASLLRQVDQQTYTFIEEFTPTTGADTVPLIGPESYYSPVVRRYREYLGSR